MPAYNAVTFAMTLAPVMFIAVRVAVMKQNGVKAVRFGERDKKDFILPPFALFFFYLAAAYAFGLPIVGRPMFYRYYVHWYGSALCFIGAAFLIAAVAAAGADFRIGLDEETSTKLIVRGPYAINRNPAYTGVLFIIAGAYITYANWIFLAYLITGLFVICRQIAREEESMKKLFGAEYDEYCKNVRRLF